MFYTLCAIFVAMTARLKDIVKTDDIALDICIRVGNRIPHTRLRSKVYNNIELKLSKQRVHNSPIGDISLNKVPAIYAALSSQALYAREAVVLDCRVVVVVQAIKTNHNNTLLRSKQSLYKICADKTRGTCHQNCSHN